MLVCIFRFEDVRQYCVEEKDRRTCSQGRNEDVGGDGANLKTKLDDDINGVRTRCIDMMEDVEECAKDLWRARNLGRVNRG